MLLPSLASPRTFTRPIVTYLIILTAGPGLGYWFTPPIPAQDRESSQAASEQNKAKAEAQTLLRQGQQKVAAQDLPAAIELYTRALKLDPTLSAAYYYRGRAQFQRGRFEKSLADFDRYVQLEPGQAPRQWERGIACFYAGKFKAGAEQFESYQKFDGNDVENSVWRFLCLVPLDGLENARRTMLPIENDRRVPMMQIYEMYRGNLEPADVLAAVDQGDPAPAVRSGQLFYARLYLGLYYEALGKDELARRYILLAADEHADDQRINHYMWSVADVHARRLRE